MRIVFGIICVFFSFTIFSYAQDEPVELIVEENKVEQKTSVIPSPTEISVWALEDAISAQNAGADISGYRYIWIHTEKEEDAILDGRVIDLAPINMAISKSSSLIRSHRVNSRLLRIDLTRLGIKEERISKLINTWERLADLDHYLTATVDELPVTIEIDEEVGPPTTIRVLDDEVTIVSDSRVIIGRAKKGTILNLSKDKNETSFGVIFEGKNGFVKRNSAQLVQPTPKKTTKTTPVKTKRTIGPQCGQAGLDLAELLQTNIPIVRHDFLLRSVMHGDIILRPLGQEGGLYYDFLQLEQAKEGETDLQAFLRTYGANLEETQRLRADVGTLIMRSGVTGRSRVITAIRGLGGRLSISEGLIFGTFDGKDGDDFNPELDPIEDVLGFKHQASEWIATLPNGLHAYALFNGNFNGQNQQIQNFAPDDVAVDRTVPAPHGTRIINGMCWRCHNSNEKEDGLKITTNDFSRLIESGRDLVSDVETVDTIASRFTSNFEGVVQRGRDDFADAVYRVTRDPVRGEGLEPYEAFGRLAEIYNNYWYELVTPRKALLDLGFVVPEEKSVYELNRILSTKTIGESAAISYLCAGIPINRWQWENVYPEAILRSQEFASELRNDQEDGN